MNAKRPDPSPSRTAAPEPRGGVADTPPAPTVLVADDDPDMRLYVKRCLRAVLPTDTVFLEAGNGADALVRVRHGDVDLLISDVVMPRTDGLELCRAVRQDPALNHLPILLVTGELSVRDIKACTREFGPVQVICKPFNADQLNAKVREMLDGGRGRHEADSEPNNEPKPEFNSEHNRKRDNEPDPEHDNEPDPEKGP